MDSLRGTRCFVGAVVALAALLLAGCSLSDGHSDPGVSPTTPSDFTDESDESMDLLIDESFPDPEVLLTDEGYVAFATNSGYRNVQVATSPDGVEWQVSGDDALPLMPAWATKGKTWAPGVHQMPDGSWRLYFTARAYQEDTQCIGVGTGDSVAGPYVAASDSPLICDVDEGGDIDPVVFTDSDGKMYLLWKNDGNSIGVDTWIWLQQLSPDGLELVGERSKLIKQDLSWEANLVEAPALIQHEGVYWLFYSANFFGGPEYATGAAWSDSLRGPYTKLPDPLLSTEKTGYNGPGGGSVVSTPEGDVMFFHAWDDDFLDRGMASAPITWVDGQPVIVTDRASS